jgi:hypothetical protein
MGLTGTLVDDKGNWYAGDAGGNNRVEVFDASGKCIRVIKAGVAAQNLALGPQGELFVGCWGDPSEVFDSTGGFLGTLAEESTPETPINSIQGLDITPDGLILTSGGDQVTLYRIVEKK